MIDVLIVEDEQGIAESLRYLLERERFGVIHVTTLAEARRRIDGVGFVILDLGLPDGPGDELLREIRRTSVLPVLVLTSRSDEVDRVVGLELGADDYVVKPFSPREVVARIKTILRRAAVVPTSGLVLDGEKRRATFAGHELPLTRTEFDLLAALRESPDRVLTREALLDRVWPDVSVTDRTVDVHIKSLRKKLQDAGAPGELIETVRGVGYRSK